MQEQLKGTVLQAASREPPRPPGGHPSLARPSVPEPALSGDAERHTHRTRSLTPSRPSCTEDAECIIDLHSGTPDVSLWYSYDAGDLKLPSSFGYLPPSWTSGQEARSARQPSSAASRASFPSSAG